MADVLAVRARAGFVLRRPGLVLAVLVLVVVVLWALAPGLFTSYDPLAGVPRQKLRAPSAAHLFGTDETGRDVFARVVHGAALSLSATVTAVLIALVIGSVLGLVAGARGGWLDSVLMRVMDVLLAVPPILLSLALVAGLGFGTTKVAVAVGVANVAHFARLMRAEVLRVRASVYVEAARAGGVRWFGVLTRHILPNAAGPVVVLGVLTFGTAVLEISALSFLGYGAAPPTPEWGSLVAGGRAYLASAWWMTTLPGLVIAAVVLSANRVSRALEGERHD
ncbi:peptide/nickel transport system permease protein [Amycolatopsis bartoniae]|uniref:ABC transporter permease n=1 Tax=Amycolatopsis bartoniae TaxID=941986 RepID=A0A8H9INR6_9PSEU|nr:ABC transporter permease [Amycolatopsis bartoniae]MBB2937693.1 peptide/nickel transport system permease protein [Amycolatopsis bartoniae]TVT08217.1 ABC transporter permease [Amycolatopsis bartoniae]GHF39975.1 ABC transporter permease [Amycolatopsis bartoniae]